MGNYITCFQKRVYNIVKKIPRGKVLTYKQVADKLGSSARAVGRALKVNPWPIIIPCHRVIRTNGEYGGYKWGRDKKTTLLNIEEKALVCPA